MEDKELYNPQNGEVIKAKRPKQFWKDWRFYVYTLIAIMLAIVSFSSCLTACAAINAGVGQKEDASYSVAQKKNAAITTDGGYSGYRFSVDLSFPSESGYAYATCYLYNDSSASFTEGFEHSETYQVASASDVNTAIESAQTIMSASGTTKYFVVLCGHSHFWGSGTNAIRYWVYYTFINTTSLGTYSSSNLSFMVVNGDFPSPWYSTSCDSSQGTYTNVVNSSLWNRTIFNTYTLCPYMMFSSAASSSITAPSYITFQDVVSYYQELGYQDGYGVGNSEGYSSGYETGHSAGYNEGYASGNANGYASGYEQATQDYQTGIAFTSYGLYANAQLTLTTDEVIGNYSYMYLFKYVTSNYDEHTVYVLFTQNSSTFQYLGYVLDRNDSDDSTSAVTIGSFSAQSSLAVTITAEQDQYFELYTGFVTSFYDRGSEVIEAVWFSGGTSQTALQNYQDGYDTGYQDGVSVGYGSGYDAGYRVGEVAGINQAEPEALTNTLVAVFQQPFNQIYRFFNFNILGLNVLGLATGLLSVFIIIKVFKKVLK